MDIKVSCSTKLPKKATKFSCGYDIYSISTTKIPPFATVLIDTDICVAIPNHICGLILGRSSLAIKLKLIIHSGLIDIDYRKPISVIVHSLNHETVLLPKDCRLAQILFLKMFEGRLERVAHVPLCPETDRDGGFGSSGMF